MEIWQVVALLFVLAALWALGSFYLAWRRERIEKEREEKKKPKPPLEGD